MLLTNRKISSSDIKGSGETYYGYIYPQRYPGDNLEYRGVFGKGIFLRGMLCDSIMCCDKYEKRDIKCSIEKI